MSVNSTDALKNRLMMVSAIFAISPALFFLAFSRNENLTARERIEQKAGGQGAGGRGNVPLEGLSSPAQLSFFESTKGALTTTATFFLGIAVMVNAYYRAKQAEAANKNAIALAANNQLTGEKLISDRLMTAITQLGHDNVATRTGAIFILERVAQESPQEYWTVMEILSAFVRENAINAEAKRLRTDIQAALTVIARRNSQKDKANQKLDLRNTDIPRADLRGANLQQLDLRGANLCGADLRGADLCRSDLDNSQLVGSILYEANLHQANLRAANLSAANLNYAWICAANLQSANLTGASLRGANLSGANLYKTNLTGVNLKLANLTRAKLFLANLEGAKLGKANLRNTGLIGANLNGANLNGANLQGANLNAAKLQQSEAFFANFTTASLQEADLRGANFMGSNMQNSLLNAANLANANLMGTNLSGANLSDVIWDGANLTGVKNLDSQQFQVASR